VVELAKLIQVALYNGPATKESKMTSIEAEEGLLNYKQHGQTTNAKYLEKFKNKVQLFKHLGGERNQVDDELCADYINLDCATKKQFKQANALRTDLIKM